MKKPAATQLAKDLDHVLSKTEGIWESFRGTRIFVSGASGFFGKWLLQSFSHANRVHSLGAHITALTRSPERVAHDPWLSSLGNIAWVEGNVRDFAFPGGEFSHIIHAAAESSTPRQDLTPLDMFETVVQGTRHMLGFAKACRARRFLLTSSGAVYGAIPSTMTHVGEDYRGAPLIGEPNSGYAVGKRAAEELCHLMSSGTKLEYVIARCFAFVGPGLPLDAHFAIGNFLRDALVGGPIHVNGDGTPYRSYLYAADLAVWLWTILSKGRNGGVYNVGSEESLSIREVAEAVASQFSPQPLVAIARTPSPGTMPSRYVPSTKLAREELSLHSSFTLSESIARTIFSLGDS